MTCSVDVDLLNINFFELNESGANEYFFKVRINGIETRIPEAGYLVILSKTFYPINRNVFSGIVDGEAVRLDGLITQVEDDPFFDDVASVSFSITLPCQNDFTFENAVQVNGWDAGVLSYLNFRITVRASAPVPVTQELQS